jgi:hypothetical protein
LKQIAYEIAFISLLLLICIWMVVEWGLAPRPEPLKQGNYSQAWTVQLPDEPRASGFPQVIKGE